MVKKATKNVNTLVKIRRCARIRRINNPKLGRIKAHKSCAKKVVGRVITKDEAKILALFGLQKKRKRR